ncbi:MAG TPA: hypothetical protein VGB72_10600 [Acidobacteriota bacterium]
MRILFQVFMLTLAFLLACGSLPAQSLEGTWVEPQYNATMVLSANGIYSFQHPGGRSQGKFGLNGRLIWMQDASSGQTIWYTVASFTEDSLTLQDSNGLHLRYRRQQQAPPPPPQPSRSVQEKAPTSPAKILAQKGGLTLTGAQVEAGVGLIQVIIGQALKPAEVKEIEARSIVEFNQNPSTFIKEINSLAQSLKTIRSQTDPLKIGLVRQQLFTALYLATSAMKEADKPLLVQIPNRYIKVLAADPVHKLVLTDRDAEGMLNYMAFQSELGGQKVVLSPELKKSFSADLINAFPSMALEQKQLLCSASLVWQLLEANWSRLTPAQKQQYQAAYLSKSQAVAPPPSPAKTSPSPKSPREAMRDYQARQNMFRMMNRMNMNTHALSLNIIENIGGTGNYWKVVDY